MPLVHFVKKFDSVKVTPRITLINEGGEWHKAVAGGAFSRAAVEMAQRKKFPDAELCFSQFLIKPLAPGPFFIYAMQRPLSREPRAPVRQLEFEASLYLFADASGALAAQASDWYFTPPKKARMRHVKGFRGKGLLKFVDIPLTPESGCYVLIPEFKALLGSDSDVAFEVTVASKCPFELRVAAPGEERASEAGVVWVSGRDGAPPAGTAGAPAAATHAAAFQAPPSAAAAGARSAGLHARQAGKGRAAAAPGRASVSAANPLLRVEK